MQIEDARALLNSLHNQVTGQTALTPTSTAEFISQATTTLQAGTDIVFGKLMQMVGQTIVAVRPYDAKFKGLQADGARWGGIIRKQSFVDDPADEDKAYHNLTDGTSVDPWTIHKPSVLETRFYGSDVFQDNYTVFEDQLKNAFSSEAEFGSFVSGLTLHYSNKWEQYQEDMARMLLASLIASKSAGADTTGVIHLLTEYNTETGLEITKQEASTDPVFWKWVRAKVNTIGRRMTARSGLYQIQIQGSYISRHTPLADQRMYLASDVLDRLNTVVNADTYHDEPLKYADVEGVDYWQSILDPLSISMTPSILSPLNGTVSTAPDPVALTDVFGVIFDKDAIGYTVIDYSVMNSPFNQIGRYYNVNLTANIRYMTDLTEKAAVLILD